MTRRISWTLAFMAVATITLFTGVASAQSPPAVLPTVIEQAELPRTGSSHTIPLTIGAVVLLLIGTALVLVTRRKKGTEPTTA